MKVAPFDGFEEAVVRSQGQQFVRDASHDTEYVPITGHILVEQQFCCQFPIDGKGDNFLLGT